MLGNRVEKFWNIKEYNIIGGNNKIGGKFNQIHGFTGEGHIMKYLYGEAGCYAILKICSTKYMW